MVVTDPRFERAASAPRHSLFAAALLGLCGASPPTLTSPTVLFVSTEGGGGQRGWPHSETGPAVMPLSRS